ncbi:MAG TPA: hypothetical protein VEG62_08860, partial [Acidimicrobiales bacterium]|nr:hypothetical protein [Acidimicrobiales bacterium]
DSASATSTSLTAPNLLDDPLFAQSNANSWQVGAGNNRALYSPAASPVGPQYLEFTPGSSSTATLWQNAAAPTAGQSYTASVYLQSPDGSQTATLVIWALGGSATTEIGQTSFTVGTTWSQFSTVLDVANTGHTLLRFQIYSPGPSLDVAGAMLQDASLNDAGFSQGLGNWNVGSGQYRAIDNSSSLPSGQNYLATTSWNDSQVTVWQDLANNLVDGDSYAASVWLRTTSSSASATVVLWGLGGSAPAELGQTQVTIGSNWQRVSTILDVANTGYSLLRFQIYASPGSGELDVNGAAVENGGVPDGGFGNGIGSWMVPAGANRTIVTGSSGPSGQNALYTNSGSNSSDSLWQDIAGAPVAGHAYTASMFLQSETGSPFTVSVVVWALGGSAPAQETTNTEAIGTSWTPISVGLDVGSAGHTFLRVQIYLPGGDTLGVAGVTMPDTVLN